MNNLLELINNDVRDIFNQTEDEGKIYKCIRCIHSCINYCDSILVKKDDKVEISKKMLIVYSYICNLPDAYIHDIHLVNIYSYLKTRYSAYAEKCHRRALLKRGINEEYHYNMILYYNKNIENQTNLYDYYFLKENYHNCIKLLSPTEPQFFIQKMCLLNNLCDFTTVHENIGKILDYCRNNAYFPMFLISMGFGNNIIDKTVGNLKKKIMANDIILPTYKLIARTKPLIVCLIDSPKVNIKPFIHKDYKTIIYDFTVTQSLEYDNIEIKKSILTENNFANTLKELKALDIDILISFCCLNNNHINRLIINKTGKIQINAGNYLGTVGFQFFDYIMLGKNHIQANKNYFYLEKKIVMPLPFLLDIDYSRNYDPLNFRDHELIIDKIKTIVTDSDMQKFLVDYFYKIIKYNLRRFNSGVYEKELLVERQIKNILDKTNINNESYEIFQNNYQKIRNILKGNVKRSSLSNYFTNIVLPRCKLKNCFKFVVLSGSKKLSLKDLLIYNLILKKSPKSVIYILETVSLENRDSILKYFDYKDRVYFLPFIAPEINIYRLYYFDCVLDTLNYNLKNTLFDIIKIGIPVLTINGNTPYSNIGYSVLSGIGIKTSEHMLVRDFIAGAVELSTNNTKYKEFKEQFKNVDITKTYNFEKIHTIVGSIYDRIITNYNSSNLSDIII